MIRQLEIHLYLVKFAFVGLALILCLPLLSLLPPPARQSITSNNLTGEEIATSPLSTYDSPNLITAGLAAGTDQATTALAESQTNVKNWVRTKATEFYVGLREIGFASANTAKAIAFTAFNFTSSLINSYEKYRKIAINASVLTAKSAIQFPGHITDSLASASSINSFIRPATGISAPVIEPHQTTFSQAVLDTHHEEASSHHANITSNNVKWPIHGRITTLFGVPHRPFQPRHTGMDISSGKPSGITPVKPFKSGEVIDTVWSRYGLGNHVIVDHGGGLSSVYAHLHSISVSKGDKVSTSTTLGQEGTTGMSTGTHLHFEVRVNGTVVDPQKYIAGLPN